MTTSNPDPRILLAFDGSAASRAAFEPAAMLARAMGAGIVLLRVHTAPARIWVHPDSTFREAELAKLAAEWQAELAGVAQEFEASAGVKVTPIARTLGQRWTVTEEILAVADEKDPIVLCLATQGESALRHFVIGSTAMDVLSRSSRPVVLVPAPDK